MLKYLFSILSFPLKEQAFCPRYQSIGEEDGKNSILSTGTKEKKKKKVHIHYNKAHTCMLKKPLQKIVSSED